MDGLATGGGVERETAVKKIDVPNTNWLKPIADLLELEWGSSILLGMLNGGYSQACSWVFLDVLPVGKCPTM